MKRIENVSDMVNRTVTYEFTDGRRHKFCSDAIRRYGIVALMRSAGLEHLIPTKRMDVYQSGEKIGTVPPDFDPEFIESKSFFYDARPGDFKLDGDKWEAVRNLCPGDFDAIPGFQWDKPRERGASDDLATLGAIFQVLAKGGPPK